MSNSTNTSGSTNIDLQKWLGTRKADDCPHCGRCKHCGRGGNDYYPTYPQYPLPYTPYNPYVYPTWTVSTSSYTIS